MKARIITAVLAASALLFTAEVNAQTIDKAAQDKAVKEAKAEAKQLEKEGYKVPVGKNAMTEQFEESAKASAATDADGAPYYFMARATATGASYPAASMSASNAAKTDMAVQVQKHISAILDNRVKKNATTADNAAAVKSFVNASKSVINNSLGSAVKYVEIYRTLDNGSTEAMVTIGLDKRTAVEAAVKAMKKTLDEDAEDLIKELDGIL